MVSSFNAWNNLSWQHLLEKFKLLMRIVNHGLRMLKQNIHRNAPGVKFEISRIHLIGLN